MIFVIVGSQKFQFNRLLEQIDFLVNKDVIKAEEVFAQTGYSTYKPKKYEYIEFLDSESFDEFYESSELVITHGGVGSLINGIKKNKKIIAVPRLQKYGEHVDDHQNEIVNEFTKTNLIHSIFNVDDLEEAINHIKSAEFGKYESKTNQLIDILREHLKIMKNG